MGAGLKKTAAAAQATRVSQKKRLLATSYIGHWVGRMKKGVPTTQLHIVETAVNDKVTTRCGKDMTAAILTSGTGMAIEQYFPEGAAKCAVCNSVFVPPDRFTEGATP